MMNGRSLENDIKDIYARYLTEFHLHIVESSYEPSHFGDSCVVLRGKEVLVRLTRDRGQVWGDVASPEEPGTWRSLVDILAKSDPELASRLILEPTLSVVIETLSTCGQTLISNVATQ